MPIPVPADPGASFISLQDAKDQLNITSTASDAELQDFIDAACDEVEAWCGAVSVRTVTGEFIDLMGRTIFNELTTAGTRDFVLRWRPVISIQAVTSAITSGVTYDPTDFRIDTPTGIVRRYDGGTIFGPLVIDYTAGYQTAPAWARLAAKIIVQHLWRTQRGSATALPGMGGDDSTVPGFGFSIPNAAAQILERHANVPAVG